MIIEQLSLLYVYFRSLMHFIEFRASNNQFPCLKGILRWFFFNRAVSVVIPILKYLMQIFYVIFLEKLVAFAVQYSLIQYS